MNERRNAIYAKKKKAVVTFALWQLFSVVKFFQSKTKLSPVGQPELIRCCSGQLVELHYSHA